MTQIQNWSGRRRIKWTGASTWSRMPHGQKRWLRNPMRVAESVSQVSFRGTYSRSETVASNLWPEKSSIGTLAVSYLTARMAFYASSRFAKGVSPRPCLHCGSCCAGPVTVCTERCRGDLRCAQVWRDRQWEDRRFAGDQQGD